MRAGSIVLFAHMLVAFCASEVRAAPCIAPPLSPAAIEQFRASPEALLAPNADTRTIEAQVRDLAGTDAGVAADLVGLAKTDQSAIPDRDRRWTCPGRDRLSNHRPAGRSDDTAGRGELR